MQDTTIILQILWTSLATSTYYVLFAVAFALVLKVTRLFNFAQAAVMTIAFYTAFIAVQWLEWPAWAAFLLMMFMTLAASYALERIGFEALRQRGVSVMFVFVFTLMVSEFIAYVAMLIFGTWPQTIFPTIFWPVTIVGEIAVSGWDIPAMAATVGALAAFFAFMRFTRTGQFMMPASALPSSRNSTALAATPLCRPVRCPRQAHDSSAKLVSRTRPNSSSPISFAPAGRPIVLISFEVWSRPRQKRSNGLSILWASAWCW